MGEKKLSFGVVKYLTAVPLQSMFPNKLQLIGDLYFYEFKKMLNS